MINQIMDLVIAYPSFQLNTIIDPEQANINNQQIVQKINFVAKEFNKLTLPGSSGASKITILPFTDVTAQDVQTALQQIMTFIKAYITSNNISVADLYAKIGLNTTDVTAIKTKNIEQDTRLTNIETKNTEQDTRLTSIETVNTTQNTRLTSVETKNTEQDTRLTAIEPTVASNTSRIQTIEAKELEIENRLYNAEIADGLNEAIVQDIDIRTTNTDNALVGLQTEFDAYKSVNVNAELVDARTSPKNGIFEFVSTRLTKAEQDTTDVATSVADIDIKIGLLPSLLTSVKSSIVDAINSLTTLATSLADGLMSKTDKTKLDGIATNANNYVHPTTAGNIHIPTGGAVGNFVKYSSNGVGVWATPTKTDVGLGNVINYGIATTAEAQAGTSNIKYMTPALVVEACKRFGGDIVGKVFSREALTIVGDGVEKTFKNYTNAKGGMVKLLFTQVEMSWVQGFRIVVDGVTVLNLDASTMFTLCIPSKGSSNQTIYLPIEIPFDNNFQIYVRYQANNFQGTLNYYINK